MGNMIIGNRIEQRRKQLGLTLDDIAQEIGLAKSTVQRYEKGAIETIKLPVIEAIARVLSVNPAWICGKTDDMTPVTSPNVAQHTEPQIRDEDIRAAFFGGADDLSEEEMSAMWDDAKDYIQYKLAQRRRKMNGGID